MLTTFLCGWCFSFVIQISESKVIFLSENSSNFKSEGKLLYSLSISYGILLLINKVLLSEDLYSLQNRVSIR